MTGRRGAPDRRKRTAVAQRVALLVGCAVAAMLTGCGTGAADSEPPTVTLTITRDFGRETIARNVDVPLAGNRTVMRLLKRFHDVELDDRTGTVAAIDGVRQDYTPPPPERIDEWIEKGSRLRRTPSDPRETLWVLNVNGVEADEEPERFRLFPGDVVQWDLRDWFITLSTRATVGAFPQPFAGGTFGDDLATTLRCRAPSGSPACDIVEGALRDAGVEPDGARPDDAGTLDPNQVRRATVLVGTWPRLRDTRWARWLERGPHTSGVFARPSPAGDRIDLLDRDGGVVARTAAGSGLVAATRPTEADLRWYVTGTDAAGLERAARALDAPAVKDAFAAAITPDGTRKLPMPAGQ